MNRTRYVWKDSFESEKIEIFYLEHSDCSTQMPRRQEVFWLCSRAQSKKTATTSMLGHKLWFLLVLPICSCAKRCTELIWVDSKTTWTTRPVGWKSKSDDWCDQIEMSLLWLSIELTLVSPEHPARSVHIQLDSGRPLPASTNEFPLRLCRSTRARHFLFLRKMATSHGFVSAWKYSPLAHYRVWAYQVCIILTIWRREEIDSNRMKSHQENRRRRSDRRPRLVIQVEPEFSLQFRPNWTETPFCVEAGK